MRNILISIWVVFAMALAFTVPAQATEALAYHAETTTPAIVVIDTAPMLAERLTGLRPEAAVFVAKSTHTHGVNCFSSMTGIHGTRVTGPFERGWRR
jgi:hypothetical protein